jgi:hypothetical protein
MVIGTAVSGDFVRDEGVTGFAREAGHGTRGFPVAYKQLAVSRGYAPLAGHMRRLAIMPIALAAPAALGTLLAVRRLELAPIVPTNDAPPAFRHDATLQV